MSTYQRVIVIAGLLGLISSSATSQSLPPNYAPPPGALNLQVTQASIAQTICKPGWTRTIRPPTSYTNALKLTQMKERHLPGPPSSYEEDHELSLELGGHPTDPRNLWPQPIRAARIKDVLENVLHNAVCGRTMTLAAAQQCLLKDWVACARKAIIP